MNILYGFINKSKHNIVPAKYKKSRVYLVWKVLKEARILPIIWEYRLILPKVVSRLSLLIRSAFNIRSSIAGLMKQQKRHNEIHRRKKSRGCHKAAAALLCDIDISRQITGTIYRSTGRTRMDADEG